MCSWACGNAGHNVPPNHRRRLCSKGGRATDTGLVPVPHTGARKTAHTREAHGSQERTTGRNRAAPGEGELPGRARSRPCSPGGGSADQDIGRRFSTFSPLKAHTHITEILQHPSIYGAFFAGLTKTVTIILVHSHWMAVGLAVVIFACDSRRENRSAPLTECFSPGFKRSRRTAECPLWHGSVPRHAGVKTPDGG